MLRPLALATTLLCIASVVTARADDVDDFVLMQMERQHIPGLSLAVIQDGQPVKLKAYGLAHLETNTPTTPETVFQIGSISKQFIAAAILLLIEDGKLSLDDSVRKYIEDTPETWQPITVRHLLTHTSGLIRETPDLQLKARSDIDALRSAYARPLAFAPGEKWQYSNLGYFALAEIITRVAQTPWPRYMHERLFAPLGMNATRTTDDLIPHRATGYHWMDTQQYNPAPVFPGVRPSGAFVSTVLDLAKWDAALNSDNVFTPSQRALLWTPAKLNDGSEKPYGFGWELGKTDTHQYAKHSGTMLGFRSQIIRYLDDRLTFVVLTNATQAMPEKIIQGIAAFYLPDLKLQHPKRETIPLSADILDGYTGKYQLSGSRVVTIARHDDTLTVSLALQLPGSAEIAALLQGVSMQVATLTPETPTRFFDKEDPRATFIFATDPEGRITVTIEDPSGKTGKPAPKLAP